MNKTQHMSLFEGLAQDPSYRQYYESNPHSMPIDSSLERLRRYSPFTISFALPTVLDGVVASGGLHDGYLQTNLRSVNGSSPRSSGVGFSSVSKLQKNDTYVEARSRLGNLTSGYSYEQLTEVENTIMAGIATQAYTGNSAQDMAGRNASGLVSEEAGLLDQRIVLDVLRQVKAMAEMPPLLMLINPNNLQLQYQRVQNYSEGTRTGYIYQAWGEGLQTLSVSGVVGAFASGVRSTTEGLTADEIAILPPNVVNAADGGLLRQRRTSTPSGVQYASRDHSASYQQLITLLNIYNSGGLIKDRIGQSKANHMAGSVVLEYDKTAYVGTMKSFSYSFSEDKQLGGLEFSFEFEVKKMFDFSDNSTPLAPYSSTQARRALARPSASTANPATSSGNTDDVITLGGILRNPNTTTPTQDESESEPSGVGFVLNTQ